jgi:MYXO-CTERM domain-containing protein
MRDNGAGVCVANPENPANISTYYSCADICVGPTCTEADGGAPADAGADGSTPPVTGDEGGVSTTPTDGGNKTIDAGDDADPTGTRAPNFHAGDGGGCSVALGATSGVSFGVTAALFALALLRRRKK